MATFEKAFVMGYGSLDKFAEADGCLKIYHRGGIAHWRPDHSCVIHSAPVDDLRRQSRCQRRT